MSDPNMNLPICQQKTKDILAETLGVIESNENLTILHQIVDTRDNDAVALIQNAFPFITKIQQDVIGHHGFTPDDHGLIQFLQCVRIYEQQDPDIAMMSNKIKSYGIPPLKPVVPG